jgi:hypothetical protein
MDRQRFLEALLDCCVCFAPGDYCYAVEDLNCDVEALKEGLFGTERELSVHEGIDTERRRSCFELGLRLRDAINDNGGMPL